MAGIYHRGKANCPIRIILQCTYTYCILMNFMSSIICFLSVISYLSLLILNKRGDGEDILDLSLSFERII